VLSHAILGKKHKTTNKYTKPINTHHPVKEFDRKTIYSTFMKYVRSKKYVEAIVNSYSLFVNKLKIKKSLTPREICRKYKNVKYLKTITKIFEKVYYGSKIPDKEDVDKYDKFFRKK
jgi:hypothetical protein